MTGPLDRNLSDGHIARSIMFEKMRERKLEIRLWDVGHGLSIWIKTPNGQNHWIDTGKNADPEFDPASYVKEVYGIDTIHYLIISHPDTDHYNGICEFFDSFKVNVICRNKQYINNEINNIFNTDNVPDKKFLDIHKRYHIPIAPEASPLNANLNGGVNIKTFHAPYQEKMSVNDSSIVTFYKYGQCVFIAPGDIADKGWEALYTKYQQEIDEIIKNAEHRILVAPHHGRETGYTQEMIDVVRPTLVLISDKASQLKTDPKFRTVASGELVDGVRRKFASTVTSGRIKVTFDGLGDVYVTTASPRTS